MWSVALYSARRHEQFRVVRDRFLLRRKNADGAWELAVDDRSNAARSVIVGQIRGDSVRLEFRGVADPLEFASGVSLAAEIPVELPLPAMLRVGDTWLEVRFEVADVAMLELAPLKPPAGAPATDTGKSLAAHFGPGADTIAQWLSSVGRLHRTAASAPEFFATAAQLTLASTGLDAAIVLVRQGAEWQIGGSAVTHPEHGFAYEPAAVELAANRPEVWRRPVKVNEAVVDEARESIVVAPVRDDAGEVIGAVYGVRHGLAVNRRRGIRPLEARYIELMADGVAAGMARRRQEVEASRQQVLLEQVFSPPVAEYLRTHPVAMAGQTREVTLLFADLRGFTSIAERLTPADAYELLAAVLELLTQAAMDHGGVVIDYYGDGMSTLWNAPLDVPDHADCATAAAIQMLETLPALSDAWLQRLRQPLELGIGLHTGEVQVGNAGTRRRFKYGPRGSAVNVVSRVQAATRFLEVPLLATDAVRRKLSSRFVTVRACTAKLVGLEQPMDLFTVFPATDAPRLRDDLAQYAAALSAFESNDFDGAERILAELLAAGPAMPAAFLAQQAAALRQGALGRRSGDQHGVASDAVIEILAK